MFSDSQLLPLTPNPKPTHKTCLAKLNFVFGMRPRILGTFLTKYAYFQWYLAYLFFHILAKFCILNKNEFSAIAQLLSEMVAEALVQLIAVTFTDHEKSRVV